MTPKLLYLLRILYTYFRFN